MNPLYPLTSPQREIWFDQMLHDGIPLYNIGGYVKIPGAIDPVLFEQAVNLLVKKHETLRTMLTEVKDEDGIPMQMYTEQLTVTVPLHDFSTSAEPHEAAMVWMQQRFVEPFKLTGSPLFRYDLLKISNECYYWLLQYHHLIIDGYGVALLNRSLAEIYTSLANEQAPNLKSPSYINFIENDRAYVESEVFNKQRQYWLSKFPTPPEPLFTPRYRSHYTDKLIGSGCEVLYLPRDFYNRLNELARQHNATLFNLLLGALYVYFTRIAGQDDFAIGFPTHNRTQAKLKETAGLFTLVNPTVFEFGKTLSFAELLQKIHGTVKEDICHQPFPISETNRNISQGLKNQRSLLFDISLSYQRFDYDSRFNEIDGQMTWLLHSWEQTPLMIYVQDFHARLDVKFDFVFNWAYFNAQDIKALQARFVTILEAVLKDSLSPIHTLPVMTDEERKQLLAWNDTETDYPVDKTLVDLFEQQVEKTPSNIAVVFEEQQLTYQQLNEQANQLAHYLLALKNQASLPDNPLIAIAVERSIEMVIGLLGILKAGKAYVPIDPSYPVARIQYMLEDSQAPVLLTQSSMQAQLPALAHDCVRVCLDDFDFVNQPLVNPTIKRQPTDLAYVIYTSGSTGMPKGVMVEHQGLVNLALAQINRFLLLAESRVLQFASMSFDAGVSEMMTTFLTGASLYLVSKELLLNATDLTTQMVQQQISHITLPPSFLSHLPTQALSGLKTLVVAGEACPAELVKQWANSVEFINAYGPTETTVCASMTFGLSENERPHIGKPIANTRIYILDTQHQIQPPGIPGELCIAGHGLARGYLNRPELTREKFIEVEIFGKTERIYKTGDLARWLPDGNLEYLGRIDHQIKLRGFRIELGEIEAVLTQHESVKEAVVILYEADENKRLVAYLTVISYQLSVKSSVLTTNQLITDNCSLITEVKDWLKARLPDYMVPSQFMVLDFVPLTPNGKIDRQALPEPQMETTLGTKPVTPTEELLASLWAEVLKLNAIHRDDNFFELGGHSLLATQLIARIRDAFEVELPVRAVFEAPKLSQLALSIEDATREVKLPPISAQPANSQKVLSFAQQRLWFLNQFEDQSSATYNMPTALRLEGNLDLNALQQSLYWLIERHQSLRSTFPTLDGQAQVQILPIDKIDILKIHDLTQLSTEAQPFEVQNRANHHAIEPFDLSQGPLFKAELFTLFANDAVLLLNMHHIISDGWSMGVFIREWQHAYTAFAQNEQPSLPPLSIQYSDYAAWQREWLTGAVLQQQVDYWRSQLAGVPELLELPTDKPRPREQSYQGAHYAQRLSPTLSQAVKSLSREQGVTLFMTLLSTFEILLSRYARQTDLCVGSPIANRTHRQTENLMGFFVNTLVLRAELQPAVSFLELLRVNRQTCLEAYAHQDIPFEMLVEQLQPTRSLSHSPLFQVMLVLQNFTLSESKGNDTTDLTLPGLEITALEPDYPIAKFDLTLSVEVRDEQLYCFWEYATDLFYLETIERMASHFEMLLTAIVDNPEQAISQLPMLTDQEIQQLIAWNDTATDYPMDKTIVDWFEQQVEKTPANIAVVFEQQQLTYQQLNEQANQLAHYLLALKNQASLPDNPLIAIAVERSIEMVIGLLGTLKAGGAYVPIDPSYPAARIQYMLEDSQAPVLLTQSSMQAQLPALAHDCVMVCLDDFDFANQPLVNPTIKRQTENLAYVIYTSGSTGMPKGVMVEHQAITLHCQAILQQYSINENDKVLQFASTSFDTSLEQLLVAWLRGARSVLVTTNRLTALDLLAFLHFHSITVADFPPAYWQQILETENLELSHLRILILGGEALPIRTAKQTVESFPTLTCFNAYGPTEAVITPTVYRVPAQLADVISIAIGRPRANTRIYILDTQLSPQPPGIPGELCIAGHGLARGYLNRPELTAEKFIEVEIFGKTERLYKTGDLARWLPDGNLEYLGRIDHQIKLRGFRIELGEIEAILTQHHCIKNAVVVDQHHDGNINGLVGYIIPNNHKFTLDNKKYYAYTACYQNKIKDKIEKIHLGNWPAFFIGDRTHTTYWKKLYEVFPRYQIAITNESARVVAAGNAIPMSWHGQPDNLPTGWDAALEQGFTQQAEKVKPNTLCVLAGVVAPKYQNRGLSYAIVNLMKSIAQTEGLDHVIIPVRPTLKYQYPHEDFIDYCQRKREDGLSFDPWLRTHETMGGKIIGYACQSQFIEGDIQAWEIWTGQEFKASGRYIIDGAMQPIVIDVENNHGYYYDLSVWVQHQPANYQNLHFHDFEPAQLREYLSDLVPYYMVPSQFMVLDFVPLTPNGKIDRQALPEPQMETTLGTKPVTPTEELLASLWAEVLKLNAIHRDDNFFELGGHSLLATQLIARIRDAFEVELPVRAVFEAPKLSQLASQIEETTRDIQLPPISTQPASSKKVLSFAQQRLWFLNQFEDQSSATYNMPAALRLEGDLDLNALQQSLYWLIERHQTLRSTFPTLDGQAQVQIIPIEKIDILKIHDLTQLSTEAQQLEVQNRANHHAIEPYDLANGPLFRASLLLLSATDSVLLLNMHHIVSDGWSMGVLMKEWQHAYTAFAQGEQPSLPQLSIQYSDYAAWQREWLQGEILQQQVDYWREQLAGVPELLELPTDKPRPPQQSYQGAHYKQFLSPALSEAVKRLSREQGVSLFMTLLSTFEILLSRYARQTDLCVGSPIANRTHRQTENLMGFFVNTLVLRAELQPAVTVIELLRANRQTCLEAYAHQEIPFEMLVEQLQPTRRLSYSPLFQVMLVLQNFTLSESKGNDTTDLTLPGLEITALEPDYPIAKFDLTLSVEVRDEQLYCFWEYATDLFYLETIELLSGHFEMLLTAIVDNPEQAISQLPMLTDQEIQQLLAWNDTATDYPVDKTMVDLFEQQVEKTPSNIAVVFEEQQLTYQQLNEQANQLAHYLLALKNQASLPDNPLIAIAVERSVEMVIGLLGILKAGGAYVPIDPSYPVARIQYMLEDSQAPVLLTQTHLKAQLPVLAHDCVRVCLDGFDFANQPAINPTLNRQADDLAYVIYTSGSTGMPKGVMIEHQGLVNLASAQINQFCIIKESRVLQFASMSFDACVSEMMTTLLTGASLYLVSKEVLLNVTELTKRMLQQKISHITLPPSFLSGLPTPALSGLKTLVVAGEACPAELVKQWANPVDFINAYGPTETTVCASMTFGLSENERPHIGKPIANTRIYILDTQLSPQPPGIPGELCIAGHGLARGYLNRPELTAEKFIEVEIFGKTERLYKTGDLARWLPDGNLEYLGRIDHQIKLRGFRIELGEIEAVLTQHEAVKEAVVILYEADENKRLVAYLTTDLAAHDLGTAVKDWLKARLPDYMVPSQFMVLDFVPLTPNGKIDRKALPEPSIETTTGTQPVTPTEELLASLWASVLKLKAIHRDDNFFELGGHSLLATQLIARIRDAFEVELPVRAVFEAPKLSQLASQIEETTRDIQLPPISAQPASSKKVLSFAQQRLWFLNQFEDQSSATYNMPAALRLEGDLDLNALQQSLYWLIERHQSLRSTFPTLDGQAQVQILPIEKIDILKIQDLTQLSTEAQQLEVQNRANHHAIEPYDLAKGRYSKLGLLLLSVNDRCYC
jgi:amino acid adenylation domain-containing protein